MSDQKGHLLVNQRVLAEIGLHIGPKNAQVGLASAVERYGGVNPSFLVVFLDISLSVCDVGGQEFYLFQALQHGVRAEGDRGHVEKKGPLDSASPGFEHAPPVLEGVGDQGVGGDGRNRHVPVPYLHGVDSDIDHVPVGIKFRHGNPVSDLYHVLSTELYAGYESQNSVLEDQQEHCGQSPKDAKDAPG